MAKYGTVDEYVDALSGSTRDVVVDIRAVVHEVLPEAGEKIAYDMATFTLDGRSVLHLAGWAQHVSIYPEPDATAADPTLTDDLAAYSSGKGTLRFELGRPVPYDLVRRVVAALGRQNGG